MVLDFLHLLCNLAASLPLFSINVAYNQVRGASELIPQMGVGNIALAVALPLLTGWGYCRSCRGDNACTLKTPSSHPAATSVEAHIPSRYFRGLWLQFSSLSLAATLISSVLFSSIFLAIAAALSFPVYLATRLEICLNSFERNLF